MNGEQKIGWKTAAALVISSMIGTGVFTSLGFQLADIQNTWSIVLIWVLGGVFALIGAFTYAELGTNFDESGGDYIFPDVLVSQSTPNKNVRKTFENISKLPEIVLI